MTKKKKTVWQIDSDGLITEVVELTEQKGDFKEGQWLIPAGCVEIEPPEIEEGYLHRWTGQKWEVLKFELVDDVEEENQEIPQTPEYLLLRLNGEFEAENQEIMNAFVKARMKDDEALQEELKAEMKELEQDYQDKKEIIEKGGNPWEVKSHA